MGAFRLAPAQRAALVSVVSAGALVALKLTVGLLAHSLGLLAEAAHSATDLVAAVLTFFAVGVASRPPDAEHPFGHGKAEHLSALAEGAFLVLASLAIAGEAIHRLAAGGTQAQARWYTFATLGVVLLIDATRALGARRAARRHRSAALAAGALHFASDFLGSAAVLVGLVLVRAGTPSADSIAALVVGVLVLIAAGRLMRTNIGVLMDTAEGGAAIAARAAIAGIEPAVHVRRLRMRSAGGRHFADVVVAVDADAGLSHGHAVADAVEGAIATALPGSDVVVHVEPLEGGTAPLRQRATAVAMGVPEVREVHNVAVLEVAGATELALHLKLPAELSLSSAHEIATHVESAILDAEPGVRRVVTHIEPLGEDGAGRRVSPERSRDERELVRRVTRECTGADPREVRFRETDQGLVAFVTLALGPATGLVEAHSQASEIEQRVRAERPDIVDVVIHTEPAE
ncbi:MAG TPA: cation diffusion facilitator family transporter [Solirubrobacteraceae bacterium]|nr:cation diffusion facilitator family transporter [Solirubrobacteraceae bacterium]